MIRENTFVESIKALKAYNEKIIQKEEAKIRSKESDRKAFYENYYDIKMTREDKEREQGKIIEACRNNNFATAIKGIYLEALEPYTLSDDAIFLGEAIVDNWIKEQGGATKIMRECKDKTYLLNRICAVVEEASLAELKSILEIDEKAKDEEEDEKVTKSVEGEEDEPKEKKEEKKSEEDKAEDEAPEEDKGEEKIEDDTIDLIDDGDDSSDKELEDDDKEESDDKKDDDNEESDDKSDDKEEEKSEKTDTPDEPAEEEPKAGDSEATEEPAPTQAEDEGDGEADTEVEVIDDEDEDGDEEVEVDVKEEEPSKDAPKDDTMDIIDDDEKDSEEEPESADPEDQDADGVEDDIEDDIETDSVEDEPEDGDNQVLTDLDKEEDVQKAVATIRQRVADAEETFIKNNAKDKEQINDLITKISNNVKTVEDMADQDVENGKDAVNQEAVRIAKRKINDITNNRPLTLFEKFTRIVSKNTIKDQNNIDKYLTESGSFDTNSVVEKAKVMYGFLETLNTLQLAKVDDKYIKNLLETM